MLGLMAVWYIWIQLNTYDTWPGMNSVWFAMYISNRHLCRSPMVVWGSSWKPRCKILLFRTCGFVIGIAQLPTGAKISQKVNTPGFLVVWGFLALFPSFLREIRLGFPEAPLESGRCSCGLRPPPASTGSWIDTTIVCLFPIGFGMIIPFFICFNRISGTNPALRSRDFPRLRYGWGMIRQWLYLRRGFVGHVFSWSQNTCRDSDPDNLQHPKQAHGIHKSCGTTDPNWSQMTLSDLRVLESLSGPGNVFLCTSARLTQYRPVRTGRMMDARHC